MESQTLTARQSEILEIIREYVTETGRPPSRPELAKLLGIASHTEAGRAWVVMTAVTSDDMDCRRRIAVPTSPL